MRNSVPAHFHGVLEVAVAVKVDRGVHALENLGEVGKLQKALPHILGHFLVGRVPGGKALIQLPGSRTFPAALPHAHGGMCSKNRQPTPSGVKRRVDLGKPLTQERAFSPHGFPGQEQRRELLPVAVRRI